MESKCHCEIYLIWCISFYTTNICEGELSSSRKSCSLTTPRNRYYADNWIDTMWIIDYYTPQNRVDLFFCIKKYRGRANLTSRIWVIWQKRNRKHSVIIHWTRAEVKSNHVSGKSSKENRILHLYLLWSSQLQSSLFTCNFEK